MSRAGELQQQLDAILTPTRTRTTGGKLTPTRTRLEEKIDKAAAARNFTKAAALQKQLEELNRGQARAPPPAVRAPAPPAVARCTVLASCGKGVQKRYSEFEALHQVVGAHAPGAKLPTKRPVGKPTDAAVVQERMVGFNEYLQVLMSNDTIACSDPVDEFLAPKQVTLPQWSYKPRLIRLLLLYRSFTPTPLSLSLLSLSLLTTLIYHESLLMEVRRFRGVR